MVLWRVLYDYSVSVHILAYIIIRCYHGQKRDVIFFSITSFWLYVQSLTNPALMWKDKLCKNCHFIIPAGLNGKFNLFLLHSIAFEAEICYAGVQTHIRSPVDQTSECWAVCFAALSSAFNLLIWAIFPFFLKVGLVWNITSAIDFFPAYRSWKPRNFFHFVYTAHFSPN